MYIKEAIVKSSVGLHARPATMLVKLAMKYKSKITIKYNEKEVDAKGMFSILGAGIGGGAKILILGEGEDENDAVEKIAELIETVEN